MLNRLLPVWTVLIGACNFAPHSIRPTATHRLDDVVRWEGGITLETTPQVANTLPTVAIDPQGGYVVADRGEFQIRRYSPTGRLLTSFGREGQGPGEFRRLSAAIRTVSGDIFGFDMGGRLTVFDSNGVRKRDALTGIAPTYDATRISDTLIAIVGRNDGALDGSLVHVWNDRRGRMQAEFFTVPLHDPRLSDGYAFSGSANVAVRADTVAAIFARADTVFLFTTTGRPLGKLPIPFTNFRKMKDPPPTMGPTPELLQWRQTFSTVSKIFWAPDGTFYIQYFDLKNVEPQWRLLHMSRRGELLFDVTDTPRLLAVSNDSRLIFLDPTVDELNVWKFAVPLSPG